VAAVTCQETRDLFSARADDALTAEERARLDAHLAACADCAREWRRFEGTVGLLRAVEPARAPVGFVDRVLAARPQPWYRRLARGLLVPWPVKLPLQAAAVLLVAGLAVVIFQRSPDLRQAARAPAAPAPDAAPAPPPTTPFTATPAAPAPGPEPPAGTREEPSATGRVSVRSTDDVSAPKETRAKSSATTDGPASLQDSRQQESDLRAERERAAPARPSNPGAVAVAPPAVEEPKREAYQERLAKESPDTPPSPAAAAPRVGQAAGQPEALRRDQRVAAVAHAEARLATPDRAAAEREIRAVVARLGGVVTSAPESLEIVVPGPAWTDLARELGRLGTLRIDRRPDALPGPLRVTVRLE
jgi:hypothetical protein